MKSDRMKMIEYYKKKYPPGSRIDRPVMEHFFIDSKQILSVNYTSFYTSDTKISNFGILDFTCSRGHPKSIYFHTFSKTMGGNNSSMPVGSLPEIKVTINDFENYEEAARLTESNDRETFLLGIQMLNQLNYKIKANKL